MVLGLEGTGGLGAPLTKGTACRAPTVLGGMCWVGGKCGNECSRVRGSRIDWVHR